MYHRVHVGPAAVLLLCSSGPWDDFVTGQTSLSLSVILLLFAFHGVIFHISIFHPVMCGKRQKVWLTPLFTLLLT